MAGRSTRGVLVAVLVAAALLLLLDVRGSGPADSVRQVAGVISGPPARALAWARTQAGARLGGAADERARIAVLEQQLTDARAALGGRAAQQEDAAAAEALAAALPVAGYQLVPGRVVARSAAQDLTEAVTLAVDVDSGIDAGMVAIGSAGAIGVVVAVAPGLCTLRLTTDPSTRLAVRVARSREAGILTGAGAGAGDDAGAATVTLLDPLGVMAAGDRVVTIGTADGLIPSDLPVGSIREISGSAADLTRTARVDPGVDPFTLDRLAVLVPQAQPGSAGPGSAQAGSVEPGAIQPESAQPGSARAGSPPAEAARP